MLSGEASGGAAGGGADFAERPAILELTNEYRSVTHPSPGHTMVLPSVLSFSPQPNGPCVIPLRGPDF